MGKVMKSIGSTVASVFSREDVGPALATPPAPTPAPAPVQAMPTGAVPVAQEPQRTMRRRRGGGRSQSILTAANEEGLGG
jgi:nitroreductase